MKKSTRPNKAVVKNDPTSSEVIEIQGRKITVEVGTFVMAMRCEMMKAEFAKKPSADLLVQIARSNFYAPMFACSSGDVPTEEEFLAMRDEDVSKWYELCVKKNPKWFDLPEEIQGKKKN